MLYRRNIYEWIKFVAKLFLVCCVVWVLEYYSRCVIQPSSRRTANLTYFLWIVSILKFSHHRFVTRLYVALIESNSVKYNTTVV